MSGAIERYRVRRKVDRRAGPMSLRAERKITQMGPGRAVVSFKVPL